MRTLPLIVVLLLAARLQAQEINRYMVFFTDKENNPYCLQEPEAFLSGRALERRASQDIFLTEADLPVTPAYVAELKETGAKVYFRSRWFNAALVEASLNQLANIEGLPMVKQVVYAAPGTKPAREPGSRQARQITAVRMLTPPPENTQSTLLGIPEMQQAGLTGAGKLIAVFDGGFKAVDKLPYFEHLFSQNLLLGQHDFTRGSEEVFRYSAHGTKALSTIAALDSATLIGTAPLASFLLAVTEDVSSEYIIEEYNWLIAAEWADSAGADIITSSLGYNTFDDPSMNYTYEDMDGQTTICARASAFASERGILLVSSAGNSGNNNWRYVVTPADGAGILSVGAVTADGMVASFSSRGPTADGRLKPEVSAQGVQTIVANESGGFMAGNGTSFAAPQIAGFAAAIWQGFPELSSSQLKKLILEAGSQADKPDNDSGWGIPYFPRLQRILLATDKADEVPKPLLHPNPIYQDQVFIRLAIPQQPVLGSLYTTSGVLVRGKEKLQLLPAQYPLFRFDLQGLQSGIYFFHLQQGQEHFVHRILKY